MSTQDGGNWAEVGFNGYAARSCGRWAFNGVDIEHRAPRTWHYVTDGSALIPCGRFGIPVAVRRDLHDPSLFGISCVSGRGCTAVGAQAHGSDSAPLAQSNAGAGA